MRTSRLTAAVTASAAILAGALAGSAGFTAASPPGVACAARPTPMARVDCLDAFMPGFKFWLAFNVAHEPPPPDLACVLRHESSTDYSFPVDRPPRAANGYEGAAQWIPATWRSAARAADWGMFAAWHVYDVPPAVQDQVMAVWAHLAGWSQWPNTSRLCGLYGYRSG